MQNPTLPSNNVLWSERDVAQYLGVSVEFLQQDRHGPRRIPFCKIGRAVRYDPVDVLSFKDRVKVTAGVGG